MSRSRLTYRKKAARWVCHRCGGDGASWITDAAGTRWTVRNIQLTAEGRLCAFCRTNGPHGLHADPQSPYATYRSRQAA